MKSFLLVFLAVLFVSSVCAEDIVTPDGYLGKVGIELFGGFTYREGFSAFNQALFSTNDFSGGMILMKPLSRYSTFGIELFLDQFRTVPNRDTDGLRWSSTIRLKWKFYIP